MKRYNIADNIIDLIVSFLTDRDQFTKLGDRRSFIRVINRSIVQGSGIGSMLFVIFIGDLKPIELDNSLTKYADDASLLVPERTDVDMSREFSQIMKWLLDNKLTVNLAKTKEIVFHRPNPKNYLSPKELEGVERVEVTKLFGVWLQSDMEAGRQVIHSCYKSLDSSGVRHRSHAVRHFH